MRALGTVSTEVASGAGKHCYFAFSSDLGPTPPKKTPSVVPFDSCRLRAAGHMLNVSFRGRLKPGKTWQSAIEIASMIGRSTGPQVGLAPIPTKFMEP